MTSYASAKGRPVAQAPTAITPAPAADLSSAETARIAERKDFILEHMPDFLPVMRILMEDGYLTGSRSVVRCTLLDESPHE
ncbi:hypothetical protein [Dechloromonas denitrificans]|uniref:hypothetical protein n=1 Tax=Dechloromonas denitrificans TaxID=281362 RepID=UPI001CF88922|nr:hypothetical protein [Dechloromonas denitrificans]UCV02342.1 hypothetical protein KI611_14750 [Dechloromonas denitrificans]